MDKENGLRNQLEDVAKYHVVNGVPKVLYLFAVENTADNMKNKIRAYIL